MTADTDASRRTSTAFAEIHKQCTLKKSDSKTKLGHQNNGRNNLSGQVGCLSVSGDGKKKQETTVSHGTSSVELRGHKTHTPTSDSCESSRNLPGRKQSAPAGVTGKGEGGGKEKEEPPKPAARGLPVKITGVLRTQRGGTPNRVHPLGASSSLSSGRSDGRCAAQSVQQPSSAERKENSTADQTNRRP